MQLRSPSHNTRGRLPCRGDFFTLASLLLITVLFALWSVAVGSYAALTRFDAVSWTPTQIVASLFSFKPSQPIHESLPVYGSVVNTPLQGVYCVDTENRVVYTGSDVLHVFEIKSRAATLDISKSTNVTAAEGQDCETVEGCSPAYYFEQVGEIYLTGWATACVFANRYELVVSTAAAPNATGGRGLAPPKATTANKTNSMNRGHYFTIIHRQLRRVLRTFANDAAASEPTPPPATDHLLSGKSLVVRSSFVDGFRARLVTPFWDGLISIEDVQTPFSAVQYLSLGRSSLIQSLVQPAEGQRRGNSTLYALVFRLSSSTTLSPFVEYSWDIEGITLPDPQSNVANAAIAPASVSERFASCYASLIAEQCTDCFPVAFAASKRGIFLSLTSPERNATYVTLLASGTACTTGQPAESGDGHADLVSAVTAPSLTGVSSDKVYWKLGEDQKRQRTKLTSPRKKIGNEENITLTQIASRVCKVAAMVVDDYAQSHLYVALNCGADQNTTQKKLDKNLVRVEVSSVDKGAAVTQVLPVRQPNILPTTSIGDDNDTEEMMSLLLLNETRLLHLTVRRTDAAAAVYTYAAFGLSELRQHAVDVAGGTPVEMVGFGLTPQVQCVFSGSANAVIAANVKNSTALVCAAPSLSAEVRKSHPVLLRARYRQPWAIPSVVPLYAVVSPAMVPLAYVATPMVEKATNEATGQSYAMANTNITIIVEGYNFVNGSLYGLESTCCFWSAIEQGLPNITAPATYVSATAMRCAFKDVQPVGFLTFIAVSTDGTVVSPTSAAFSVQGVAVGVRLQVRKQPQRRYIVETKDCTASTSPTSVENKTDVPIYAQSAAQVTLPDIEAVLVDAVFNDVQRPNASSPLYALLSFHHKSTVSNLHDIMVLNGTTAAEKMPDAILNIDGGTLQPFAADGKASFAGITLHCPPRGTFVFDVYVSDSTHVLPDYQKGSVKVQVEEGPPYAPVFVGWPSTWYYPDVPLLLQQPVVGVQDVCGNVYSYLNDSVLVGPLTVQLYIETVVEDRNGNVEVVRREPYGVPWEMSTPLNNLFYISNISFPAVNFSTRFYINVTCDLPQPTIVSPPIVVVPCKSNRESRLVMLTGVERKDGVGVHSRIVCGACPSHGICNGTSAVRAEDGYWRFNASTIQFTSCRAAFGMAEACVNDGQCAAGYQGVLCGECAPGYHTFGRACRKCLSRGTQGFLVVFVALVVVLVMTACVVFMALIPPSTLSVLSIRSLLLAVQITSLLIHINVPWPQQLETLFNGLYALAEVLETIASCFISPQGSLILIACSPLVLIPVVTFFAGMCLRLVKLHRVDAYQLSAVVLMALLHRKQERFHQLRHTIAREMVEQHTTTAAQRHHRTHQSASQQQKEAATAPGSNAVTPSATRLSLLEEWKIWERNATALCSLPPPHASSASAASAAQEGERCCMEDIIIDAFTAGTAAVLERMVAAEPQATWEQLVVKAMRDNNVELLNSVRGMHLPLLSYQQVRQWAEHTTEIVVPVCKRRVHGKDSAAEELASSLSRSGIEDCAMDRSPPQQKTSKAATHKTTVADAVTYTGANGVESAGSDTGSTTIEKSRRDVSILWKRDGMIAAYREMAIHQFRASWAALLASSASMVLICYYLPLLRNAFMWLHCVTVQAGSDAYLEPITIPPRGSTLSCSSAEYHAMRKLATVMLAVYGCGFPVLFFVGMTVLQHRYGEDIAYAALPVIFFGDSTFEYIISITYMLTKLIAVVAVTQMDAPMLQMGVLATLVALTIFFNSVWSGSGRFVVLRSKYPTVTLRSVMTAARVMFLLVCQVLLLLIYLIVTDYDLSASGKDGLAAVISLGIGSVFALFTAVLLHQFAAHIRHACHYSSILTKRKQEEQQLLEALVRRYLDVSRTIELYLKVCERGLTIAQRLDTLPGYHRAPDGDAIITADENPLSFSSFNNASHESTDFSNSVLLEATKDCKTTLQSVKATTEETAPEALTHFSPHPALTQTEPLVQPPAATCAATAATATAMRASTKAAKRPMTIQRGTAPHLFTARRLSTGSLETNDAFLCSSSAPSPSRHQLQQQQKRAEESPTSSLLFPREDNLPSAVTFVAPVEGNPNWVSVPTQSAAEKGKRKTKAKAGDDADRTSPNNCGKVNGAGRGAACTPHRPECTVSPASVKHSTEDVARTEDTGKVVPPPTPLKTSPKTSGDFTEVQMPGPQPLLKRSSSLLLSIRGFDPVYAPTVESVRHVLVEGSRAVATAEYEKERRQQQQHVGSQIGSKAATSTASKSSGITDDAVSRVRDFIGFVSDAAAEAEQQQQQTQQQTHSSTTPETAVTLESLVPAVEMDLAASFDPLTVPPLPLTRALSRLRPMCSSPFLPGAAAGIITHGSTHNWMAGLQKDLEAELRELHVIPLQDSLLDMDLHQLVNVPSQIQNAYRVSFSGGAETLDSMDSASPLSVAVKSRTNRTEANRGGAAQTSGATLHSSKSFPGKNMDEGTSASPVVGFGHGRLAQWENATSGAGTAAATSTALQTPRREGVNLDEDGGVPASSDKTPPPALVPPLPRFCVPHIQPRSTYRTLMEYVRHRAARASRAQRSRTGGEKNSSSSHTKYSAASAADTKRAPQDSKSLDSTDTKQKTE